MKKIIVTGLLLFICVVVYYFGFYTNNKTQSSESNPLSVVVSIDSEEAAISQVKKESVKLSDFYTRYESFGKIKSYARFDEEKNYWIVIFYPENTTDLSYEFHLSLDGMIVYEREGAGG